MKYYLLLPTFLISLLAQAQDPVTWSFSSKKTGEKTYEVTITAIVESPWHIYSQKTPDGGPLPTRLML